MELDIQIATSENDLNHIRLLFNEYQDWLGEGLCFQGFQEELSNLKDKYDCLLLARWKGTVCACAGFWPDGETGTCEMKRLYVQKDFRNNAIGRKLAEETIQRAKEFGYQKMRLETLNHLTPAIKLYESLGFINCATYDKNPLSQVVCMEKSL